MVRRVLSVVLAVALSAAALGFAVFTLPLSQYRKPADAEVPLATVEVVSRGTDLAEPAVVDLTWTDRSEVRVSSLVGLVTAVFVEPGAVVECGDPIVEVDGVVRFGYCAPRPLYRELSSVSRGDDVDEFVGFLRGLGFFADTTDRPTNQAVRDAIRFFQGGLGNPVTGVVDPGDAVWLGDGSFVATSVGVVAGDLVAPGDAVMSAEPVVSSALVTRSSGDAPLGGWVFGVDGSTERFTVGAAGSIDDVAGLLSVLVGQELAAETPTRVTGTARLAELSELATVPASSVVNDGSTVCVHVADGSGGADAVEVTLEGSSVGVAFVAGDLRDGIPVVVNPDRSLGC